MEINHVSVFCRLIVVDCLLKEVLFKIHCKQENVHIAKHMLFGLVITMVVTQVIIRLSR